ncbi:MAG: hypothetical protein ACXVEF_27585 [Polyangiales bacterium]
MNARLASIALISSLFLVASSALADEAVPPSHAVVDAPQLHETQETETHWYGGQTLLTDGAALGLGLAAAKFQSDELAWLGLGTYVLGGPIVHATHGNWGRAAGSLALRVGLPATLMTIGCQLDDTKGDWGCIGAVIGGFVIGTISASIIDSTALAYERVPKQSFTVAPTASVTKDSIGLGLAGTF